jgi:predicted Rossmann fold flavoprotein
MEPWDIVVIGAGAAGLLAGARAAEMGCRVLVLEKNRKPGAKILMSGGTRCNLTQATDARGIVAAFGPQGKFLHSALAALSPQDLVDLIEAEGVPTKVEPSGKVFPVSDRSVDVQTALLRRLGRSGAVLRTAAPVRDVQPSAEGWNVTLADAAVAARRIIVCTGGKSYPGCGTTGDGWRWLQRVGLTIVPPRPALVPLKLADPWAKDLSGLTIPDVAVGLVALPRDGTAAWQVNADRGSFLFTHFGCSGPVILNVSRRVEELSANHDLRLSCDWLPRESQAETEVWLRDASGRAGRRSLAVVLAEKLPRRLAEAMLRAAGLPVDRPAAGLPRGERTQLARAVHDTRVTVTGTLGFPKAEVTTGGVALADVDSRTLACKRLPSLHLAGEILDLDGRIGGYNFQAAFSTGWLAASAAAVALGKG